MMTVKRYIKAGLSLAFVIAFALNCARGGKTQFTKNLESDADKPALTYEEWVALVGQQKTDQLYAGLGQDTLNLLQYGIGQSNMVQLINGVSDATKLVTLIGNDAIAGTGPGAATGLGAVITIYLLKSVDTQLQANLSSNLVGGGTPPTDQDTIANLVSVINALSATEVQTKLVDLFGAAGFNLSRSLAVNSGGRTPAEQQLIVNRMSRVVAHVDNTATTCTKVCSLLTNLSAADVTGKMSVMIMYNLGAGIAFANKLVETIETTTDINRLRAVISTTPVGGYSTIPGVTVANITAKMMPILDTVTDCTKMGYTINNVTNIDTLINLISNVQVPARMGQLINLNENGATWTGQTSPAETWGVPTKAAPFGTAGSGATITGNVAGGVLTSINVTAGGTNYLPGITLTFPGCTTQPTVHLTISGGVIATGTSSPTGPHWVIAGGAGCTNGAAQPATIVAPSAPSTTGMPRLVGIINGITPASDYYKLLALVDTVSDMNKMVRLVQDLKVVTDITDLLNNMTGVVGTGCTVANGTDTMTITGGGGSGAAATSFNVSNGVAYIRVTSGGSGYTSQPTMSVPGCTGVTFTATISGGVITQITANNPLNNMAQVVELMTLANMPRLQQVVDGQRIFNNTNEASQTPASSAATYLGKLRVLMVNLSQPLEGPLKVGDLLNGVTNTDKIIDLIWGVTTTTNLATIINNIFKASEVPGCSDGSAGTLSGSPPVNTYAKDTGTCEQSGDGAFFGERDRAVTTMVYLVENVADINKLITMIDNILPANIVALVNHTATYCQHDDATTHVYPRGGTGLDPQAAGKRLAKIVDNVSNINQLVFITNNVSSIIKMAKLVSFMPIGTVATDGTGKLAVLINAVTGTNAYLATTVPGRGNPTGNATGMGKMVNVIEFISGATTSDAMLQLRNLMNDVTDINKMADLINQTVNSSNIVGLLNAVTDPRYNTSTTDLVTLMNNLPRGEVSKLVYLISMIGNATGTTTATFPGEDHKLIAQLMSAYNAANIATTSGVGVSLMNTLMGTLSMSGGQNYTSAPTITISGGGGTGAAATALISASAGAITRVNLTAEGTCTTAPTGVTASGGTGASFTIVTAPKSASATEFAVKAVYINNGGSGYSAGSLTFTGGTCSTAPAATYTVNGVIGASVTAGGSNYTNNATVSFTGGGGTGASATALVAGAINSLTSFYGGSGYTTGNVCPINGAGGDGTATCTVTASGGAVTGCSAIAGGNDYIDGQIVSIGGAAVLRGNVTAGNLTSMTVINSGCGYAAAPTITVLTGTNECATAGSYTAVLTGGRVTSVTVVTAATGCPQNPTIVLSNPAHGDGATAIVNNVTAATGRVVAISLSNPATNLAQLLANTEKAPLNNAINYNSGTGPNISAREAMVRMLHHGVSHTSSGYLIANGGSFSTSTVDYPGIGAVHIAQNVLNNLSGAGPVMTVVNMLNSDTTSLTDLVVLIGCGDHVEYARVAPLTNNDFHTFCSGHNPNLW